MWICLWDVRCIAVFAERVKIKTFLVGRFSFERLRHKLRLKQDVQWFDRRAVQFKKGFKSVGDAVTGENIFCLNRNPQQSNCLWVIEMLCRCVIVAIQPPYGSQSVNGP